MSSASGGPSPIPGTRPHVPSGRTHLSNDDIPTQPTPEWYVNVYVDHGYYRYPVSSMSKAIAHGETIMASRVYRHVEGDSIEMFHVHKVKITGPGLTTEYPDEFCRT